MPLGISTKNVRLLPFQNGGHTITNSFKDKLCLQQHNLFENQSR